MPSFAVTLRSFLRRIWLALLSCNPRVKLKNSASGYVLILMMTLIPLFLFGTKYILDQRTLQDRQATGTEYMKDSSLAGKRLIKQCAQEAALAVAQKWNPALTYKQQREAMLRIADEVYNKAPTYVDSTVIRAVHGLDVPQKSWETGKKFEPIKITQSAETRLSPSLKQIARTTNTTNMKRYYYEYGVYAIRGAPIALYHFYIIYASLTRTNSNLFPPDEDLYTDYCYYSNSSAPLDSDWYHYVTWPEVVGMSKIRWINKGQHEKLYN